MPGGSVSSSREFFGSDPWRPAQSRPTDETTTVTMVANLGRV
jgi:hypothetical protein